MSTAVKEMRKPVYWDSQGISQTANIFEDEKGMSELEIAKSRRNDEFISGRACRGFMNRVIHEKQSSQKGIKRV